MVGSCGTFSCSSCRTLAWECAVVDLKDSLRCSSMVLLCSTNLHDEEGEGGLKDIGSSERKAVNIFMCVCV